MSSLAFSGFQITKINKLCTYKLTLHIKLNQSLLFFVYESLENAYLRFCNELRFLSVPFASHKSCIKK